MRRSEKITRRMNTLARRFGPLFKNDSVLSRLATAEDTLLEFSEAVRLQIQQRGLWIQKQSLPVSRRMGDLIREIRAEFPRQRRDADSVKPARSNRPGRARPGLDRDSGPCR